VSSRTVRVKGPRGSLSREFKHLNLEMAKVGKARIRVDSWFSTRKETACVRTVCSHIENMITGVTKVRSSPAKCLGYSIGGVVELCAHISPMSLHCRLTGCV
jgi:large subunit ribosomal protein L9e